MTVDFPFNVQDPWAEVRTKRMWTLMTEQVKQCFAVRSGAKQCKKQCVICHATRKDLLQALQVFILDLDLMGASASLSRQPPQSIRETQHPKLENNDKE